MSAQQLEQAAVSGGGAVSPPGRHPWLLTVSLPLLIMMLTVAPEAGAEVAGRYQVKGQGIRVNVESWGENCGPQPRSASGGGGKIVQISRVGTNLMVGRQRTDRCWSRNPRVQRQRAAAGAKQWTVVCQTPAGDPRFERGEYTLQQVDDQTLRFREVSRYNWRLEGDHCVATVTLTRSYVRLPDESQPSEPSPLDPSPTPPDPEPPQPAVSGRCAGATGEPVRLDVRPSRVEIRPGERVCFRAIARNREGCPVSAGVSWRRGNVDGQPMQGSLGRDGCFEAGETPAEAEGQVVVVATAGGLNSTAQVTVRMPDIGALVAARLAEGSDGQPEPSASTVTEARAGAAQGLASARVASGRQRGGGLWWLLALVGAVVIALVVATILLVRRRRATDDDLDRLDEEQRISATMAVASSVPPQPEEAARKVCPSCGREFTGAVDFCPDDATKLVASTSSQQGEQPHQPLICPRCRRGFQGGERYCSKDSEELVPYSVWRASQLEAKQAQQSGGGGMICPKCAKRYDQGTAFCHNDGNKLEPIN